MDWGARTSLSKNPGSLQKASRPSWKEARFLVLFVHCDLKVRASDPSSGRHGRAGV